MIQDKFIFQKNSIVNKKKIFHSKIDYHIEKNEVIDIDNLDDLQSEKI